VGPSWLKWAGPGEETHAAEAAIAIKRTPRLARNTALLNPCGLTTSTSHVRSLTTPSAVLPMHVCSIAERETAAMTTIAQPVSWATLGIACSAEYSLCVTRPRSLSWHEHRRLCRLTGPVADRRGPCAVFRAERAGSARCRGIPPRPGALASRRHA
jgi:hypothetical protein